METKRWLYLQYPDLDDMFTHAFILTTGTMYSDIDNNRWVFNGKEWKLLNWSGKGQLYIKNKPKKGK